MLYSDIKRETLSHIMQYTQRGSVVSASYNSQADYVNRIPHLINDAIVHIRTTVKPDPVVYPLVNGEDYAGSIRFELPDNFWALKTGGVSLITDDRFERTNEYRLQGKKHILVPKNKKGSYVVEYYRYPDLLNMDAKDTDELDEDIEVVQAATYYAAANLVIMEDEFTHSRLYAEYEARLMRMSRGITLEVSPVHDVYGFDAGWC